MGVMIILLNAFHNFSEMYTFLNEIEDKFGTEKNDVYNILHVIKHEEFLSS